MKAIPARCLALAASVLLGGCAATGAFPSAGSDAPGPHHASDATRMDLGRLILHSDPARAEALFSGVAAERPRDAAALNDLGIARDLQRRHSAAQDAYRQALLADPAMRAARVNLALSLALSGKVARARAMIAPIAAAADASAPERGAAATIAAMADGTMDARR
jgi:Flp pilus assembly protein TadD